MTGGPKPTVALTLGDPAGIGSELIAKLLARRDLMQLANAAGGASVLRALRLCLDAVTANKIDAVGPTS